MEARRWQSPAAAAAVAEAAEEDGFGGGAGGPSRRPLRRGLQRASPYGLAPRRLLPKLPVASRIFPALARGRADSDNNQEFHRESLEAIQERQPQTYAATTGPPTSLTNRFNLLLEDGCRNPSDGSDIVDIEKTIKQRHFSRDETERLIEIMRSRTPDLNVEDQRASGSTANVFEALPLSTPPKLIEPQSTWRTDICPPSSVHEVGSSPIEIAKAFMEAQTSASVHESQKRKFRALSHGVDTENPTSKIFPNVATSSSVCWPGSVVRDYPSYLTPESNKRRTPPRPFSRTPYSGSVFRRSIKNSRHGGTYNNSSGQSQLSTPFSVGSKMAVENKMVSTSGVKVLPSFSIGQSDVFGTTTPILPREGSAATKNVTFTLQGSHGEGMTESGLASGHVSAMDNNYRGASASVHPKSSETAYKILQHLEKTIPSPTAKPLELRQALAKRNISSVVNNRQLKGFDPNISSGHGQSSVNKSDSACLEIADAKKVQGPPSSPNVEDSCQKIQSSRAIPDVPAMPISQHPLKSDLTSTSAAVAVDKNTSKGTFTFPVAKAPSSLLEPPPTPTLASPPARSLPVSTEDIPRFSFGPSNWRTDLIFSFDYTSSSLGTDGTVPAFKMGSDEERELSFDLASKDAVCF